MEDLPLSDGRDKLFTNDHCASQSEYTNDRSDRFRSAAASCAVRSQISSGDGVACPPRSLRVLVVFLSGNQQYLSTCQRPDPRAPGAGHPESPSRRWVWSGRFLDIHRGPLRRCPEFPDMDLPFDHKCPAFRAEDSSNVACARGDFDGFHSVAGIEICVSKP